jgi:hypothetical protein
LSREGEKGEKRSTNNTHRDIGKDCMQSSHPEY